MLYERESEDSIYATRSVFRLASCYGQDYRIFRKFLLKDGFLPLQESVYAKLVVNDAAAGSAIARVRKNRPPSGLVQILKVTESQFATMDYITGDRPAYEEIDTMEELLIL